MRVLDPKRIFLPGLFASAIVLSGCGASPAVTDDKNSANVNANRVSVMPAVPDATPVPLPPVDKAKVEEALKKEGFAKLTLDTSTSPPTLRGTIAKEKLAIAILVAEKAAGQKLINGLMEK